MPDPLSTIGTVMPHDFPQIPYEAVHKTLNLFLVKVHPGVEPPQWWREWAAAWNGLALRFLSCDRHDAAYRALTSRAGGLNHGEISTQNERLFDFFMNGLSVLENACYGLFAIGWALNPVDFPEFTTDEDRRKIVAETEQRFKAAFPNTRLTIELGKLIQEPRFKAWRNVRRIVFHRTTPGRIVNAGGLQHGRETWRLEDTSTAQLIALDGNTTAPGRDWLAITLKSLLEGAEDFATHNL